MKINKILLQRFFDGTCSESERKEVEAWLKLEEHDELLHFDQTTKNLYKKLIWQNLAQDLPIRENNQVIPFYKRLSKYAAVTFFVLAVFSAGRFSVHAGYANTEVVKKSKEMLHVYGENGSYAQIEGEKYDFRFDGIIKIYNGSSSHKVITCGAKEFKLQPFQTYFLIGSHTQPQLLPGQLDEELENLLAGDFSIRVFSEGQ